MEFYSALRQCLHFATAVQDSECQLACVLGVDKSQEVLKQAMNAALVRRITGTRSFRFYLNDEINKIKDQVCWGNQ